MKQPYRLVNHLGTGCNGTVFEARFGNGNSYAIKFQYGPESSKRDMSERARAEKRNLERLRGVKGIPQRPITFPGIFGNFDELGFGDTGISIRDTYKFDLFYDNEDELTYGHPLLSELVPNARHLGPDNKQPEEFFDELEEIQQEVHKRGLLLPPDLQILVSDGEPYVVDWHYATNLKKCSRLYRARLTRADKLGLQKWRKRYQEGFDEELPTEVMKAERTLREAFHKGLQVA